VKLIVVDGGQAGAVSAGGDAESAMGEESSGAAASSL
jgi:hypothetical protein